ncbi:sporulation integral membrane protein YtvI [Bacillus timonensis]|nr:sporulation integral membrane protein YtvI [Bacillus timonensis]
MNANNIFCREKVLTEMNHPLVTRKGMAIIILATIMLAILPYSFPLILGIITALMLERFVRKLNKWVKKRLYSVIVIYFLFLFSLFISLYVISTVVIKQLFSLFKMLPSFIKIINNTIFEILSRWAHYSEKLPRDFLLSIEDSFSEFQTNLIDILKNLTEQFLTIITSLPNFMFELIVYLLVVFLFLVELPSIKFKLSSILKKTTKKKIKLLISEISRVLFGFFKAQVILSAVTFILSFIGLVFLNIPYAFLLAILIVIVDLLPILGTGSFLVPWAIFSIINGDKELGIGLIILFLVITVIRRIIEPKIISSNLGISPLAALVSMFLGFKLIGVIGLLLGPGLVILFDVLKQTGFIRLDRLKKIEPNL